METNYALDLKVARRRSGLSQKDVAHLLGISRVRVSKLECNLAVPSPDELTMLSLIYSQSFLTLGGAVMPVLYRILKDRLETLPNRESYAAGASPKSVTLNTLSRRLEAPLRPTYDD